MRRIIELAILFVFSFATTHCTKVVTYAVDHQTEAVVHKYSSNVATVVEKTKQAFAGLGYEVLAADAASGTVTTGWRPVTADSHYLYLFKRRDYSASQGSYYQMVAGISEDGNRVKVALHSVVKSIGGKCSSSHVLENQVFQRLDDLMRSPQIEMTNVGVTER